MSEAFGDESAVSLADGRRVYVMAVTVLHPGADHDAARWQLRQLLPTARQRRSAAPPKLHWADERAPRRTRITETITGLAATTHLALCGGGPPKKDERSRRICVEQLMSVLPALGVNRLVLERRDPTLDRREVAHAQNLRRHGIGHGVRLEHADPASEELLWIPDAVAGACSGSHRGPDPHWALFQASGVVHVYDLAYR